MFGWGSYYREYREGVGEFTCPRCLANTHYGMYCTYRYYHFHICLIPIVQGKERVGETVRCDACGASLPITTLAINAPTVRPTDDAYQKGDPGIQENLGKVVELTDAAAREIVRRLLSGKFGPDTAVRIQPPNTPGANYRVAFDYALADGNDWLGESHGIGILVDRRDTPFLLGRTIDFRDDIFCDAK